MVSVNRYSRVGAIVSFFKFLDGSLFVICETNQK